MVARLTPVFHVSAFVPSPKLKLVPPARLAVGWRTTTCVTTAFFPAGTVYNVVLPSAVCIPATLEANILSAFSFKLAMVFLR